MLPSGVLSTSAVVAASVDPVKQPRDFLIDWERAGKGLNDASEGLLVKIWQLEVVKVNDLQEVRLSADGVATTVLFTGTEITEASLAFDQNMRPFVAFVQAEQPKIYWYDSLLPGQTTTNLPSDTVTPRCCVDEKREWHLDISDIILAYIRGGWLCVKYQRERYLTEHQLIEVGADANLVSVSLNKAGRIQFRIRQVTEENTQFSVQSEPYIADIVADLCARSGIGPKKLDLSELYDDTIVGYKVDTEDGYGKIIQPLLDAYFIDASEHDRKIFFKKRGGEPLVRIHQRELVDRDGKTFVPTLKQEAKLARQVSVNHLDPAGDFQKNKQTVSRKSNLIRAKAEKKIEVPFVMHANDAMTVAVRSLKIDWYEQQTFEMAVPLKYSFLTTADVFEFEDYDGNITRMRIDGVNEDGNVFELKTTADAGNDVYSGNAVGLSLGEPVSTTPGLVGETRIEILNIPCQRDQDDELGIYIAMAGDEAATGWYGATLLISTDEGITYEEVTDTGTPATLGDTETALLEEISSEYPSIQTVRVKVNFGLESVEDAVLLNKNNKMVIGDEIIQFKTATALGDNVYILSGLIRGRYNTKPVAHPVATRVVFLDAAVLFVQAQQWMLDREIYFKPVSYNQDPDETIPTSYDYDEAINQTEWPPAFVEASRDVSNNVTVSWMPRPRLGAEISPHESKYFAGYRVKFTDGYSEDTMLTTITRASTPASQTVTVCGLNSITGEGEATAGVLI